ncbi:MAG: hypothetical protein G01um101466_464 [Parcubacteria group bacterium Gr01-1014_66]|nr:MAG: hypothetical protein G01um101466_464 [Parcubacteria group bacterium Gr01-1014_66]
MAVFDFDGVLFDDRRFKKDYESLFFHAGISKELYEKSYVQAKKKGYYDPRIHSKLATRGLPAGSVIEKKLYARLLEFAKKTNNYIFPDVAKFIAGLGDEYIRTILLSTGDPVFQNQKISKSGIADLFDEIIIIPDASKQFALRSLIRKEQPISVVFVDDKKEVLEDVKKSLPSVYAIQLRRDSTSLPARHVDALLHDTVGFKNFIDEWKANAK